jgi:hypothetical protein
LKEITYMKANKILKRKWNLIFLISTLLLTSACAGKPQVIEVTRVVPQTVVVTPAPQTMVVTPEPQIKPGKATVKPTSTLLPITLMPRATWTPTPLYGRELYYPIEDCAPSRLHVGDYATITYGGGRNAIRYTPDVHSTNNIIGYAEQGELMQILDGPQCSWGWLLWNVVTQNNVTGWTPESDGISTFMRP